MASNSLKSLSLVASPPSYHSRNNAPLSPAAKDQGSACTIKHIDFEPLSSPSNYRINSFEANRPSHSVHRYSNGRVVEQSPSTGSSSSFNFIDLNVRRWSNGSTSDIGSARNRYSGSLAHQHRCDMSPHIASATDDHRYRDDGLWHETNAQSNQEIRLTLVEALEELRAIRRTNQEDGFEMQRLCAYWEAKFTKVTNQIIDFYSANWLEQNTMDLALHICACCLDLEIPYRGIWNACDRIRDCLTPEQQYQDDYLADPESSDVEVLPDEGKLRHTTSPPGRNDDARYCSQGYQAVSAGVNASRQLATHPSDDLIFDCES